MGRKIRVDTGGTKGILYLFSRERVDSKEGVPQIG
jgi:hypothetical protein